jgi:hypothetical protein
VRRKTTTQTVPTRQSTTLSPPLSRNDTARNCRMAHTLGYGYRQMHHWVDSLAEKRRDSSGNNRTSATLHFRVRASSDAHILLSMTSNPIDGEPVYEVNNDAKSDGIIFALKGIFIYLLLLLFFARAITAKARINLSNAHLPAYILPILILAQGYLSFLTGLAVTR